MIRLVLGLMLFVLATINHSTLYTNVELYNFRVKRVAIYSVVACILILFQGILGLSIVVFGIDPIYHSTIIFSAILALLVYINVDLMRLLQLECISLRKEGFEAMIYTVVIHLFLYHTHVVFTRIVVIVVVASLTTIIAFATFYLWKYASDISKLVEFVDIKESAKAFTFSCMLIAVTGIVLDTCKFMGCGSIVISLISLLITYALLLKELMVKYVQPMKS